MGFCRDFSDTLTPSPGPAPLMLARIARPPSWITTRSTRTTCGPLPRLRSSAPSSSENVREAFAAAFRLAWAMSCWSAVMARRANSMDALCIAIACATISPSTASAGAKPIAASTPNRIATSRTSSVPRTGGVAAVAFSRCSPKYRSAEPEAALTTLAEMPTVQPLPPGAGGSAALGARSAGRLRRVRHQRSRKERLSWCQPTFKTTLVSFAMVGLVCLVCLFQLPPRACQKGDNTHITDKY